MSCEICLFYFAASEIVSFIVYDCLCFDWLIKEISHKDYMVETYRMSEKKIEYANSLSLIFVVCY